MADQNKAAIRAAARAWSDRSSDTCGVNREDNWKTYSEEFVADTEAVLAAYFAAAPAVPAVDALTFSEALNLGHKYGLLPCTFSATPGGVYFKANEVFKLLATPSTAPDEQKQADSAHVLPPDGAK